MGASLQRAHQGALIPSATGLQTPGTLREISGISGGALVQTRRQEVVDRLEEAEIQEVVEALVTLGAPYPLEGVDKTVS